MTFVPHPPESPLIGAIICPSLSSPFSQTQSKCYYEKIEAKNFFFLFVLSRITNSYSPVDQNPFKNSLISGESYGESVLEDHFCLKLPTISLRKMHSVRFCKTVSVLNLTKCAQLANCNQHLGEETLLKLTHLLSVLSHNTISSI